jgi:hypothetical protein
MHTPALCRARLHGMQVSKELDTGATITQLALLPGVKSMLAATESGSLRTYKYPLTGMCSASNLRVLCMSSTAMVFHCGCALLQHMLAPPCAHTPCHKHTAHATCFASSLCFALQAQPSPAQITLAKPRPVA